MRNFHISYKMVTSEEFNEHLDYIKENKYIIKLYSYEEANTNGMLSKFYYTAYLKINFVNVSLTYKRSFGWVSVKHNLSYIDDEGLLPQETDPRVAYATFQKYCHIEDLSFRFGYELIDNKISWAIENFGGLRYVNEKYAGKRYENVYGYDMNSAFLNACVDLVIPTTFVGYSKVPKEDEMGFDFLGTPIYNTTKECYYVFKCGINPDLTRWAREMYKKKRNAKNDNEKQKWKDMGTFAIGCLARHNPFVRNCILYKSNQIMEELIDENTLLCNTDSIVSLVERNDLKIGTELGEFKLEHQGNFALTETGYQWNYSLPTVCGFTKEKAIEFEKIVGRKYDLLKDGMIGEIFIPRLFDMVNYRIINRDINEQFRDFLRRYYGK